MTIHICIIFFKSLLTLVVSLWCVCQGQGGCVICKKKKKMKDVLVTPKA